MDENIKLLEKIIKKSNNIVFFGGAGVSTASGIPDFRSSSGLYSTKYGRFAPETILSKEFFYEYPDDFYKFFKEKMIYLDAKPNVTHLTLARLERLGKLKGVITQNIDGLHQMAGSKNVVELHGSIHRYNCNCCNTQYSLQEVLASKDVTPTCEKGHIIKPNVVLYDEALDSENLERARELMANADTLIVGGTSLTVYPAAGLIDDFGGTNFVIVNKSRTPYDSYASLVINEDLNETFSHINASLGKDRTLPKSLAKSTPQEQ